MIYAITTDGKVAFVGDRKPAKGEEVYSDAKSLKDAVQVASGGENVHTFLVRAYNSLPGMKPVKKFENVTIGLARLLKATVGVQVGGKATAAKASAAAPKAAKTPAKRQAAPKTPRGTGTPGESKKETIITMLREGATGKELQVAVGWAPHSVRGFISTLGKTEKITSSKSPDGGRFYKLG